MKNIWLLKQKAHQKKKRKKKKDNNAVQCFSA